MMCVCVSVPECVYLCACVFLYLGGLRGVCVCVAVLPSREKAKETVCE